MSKRNFRNIFNGKISLATHVQGHGCRDRENGFVCTRIANHKGRHEAGVGPQVLGRFGPEKIVAVWDQ